MSRDDMGAPLPNRDVIKLESGDSASDWMALLKEFDESSGQKRQKMDKSDVSEAPKEASGEDEKEKTRKEKARERYQELCRTPSIRMEQADMMVLSEFSNIIAKVNEAGKTLSNLQKYHGEAYSRRLVDTCRDNLKETSTVMLKEFHAMRHGRQQKKYSKRNVCVACHNVFMVPLPADGLCDECRASRTPRSAPY